MDALVWDHEGVRRVLEPELASDDKVLCLLQTAAGWMEVKELCRWLDYANQSRFRTKILARLHRQRVVVFDRANDRVILTPLGEKRFRITLVSRSETVGLGPVADGGASPGSTSALMESEVAKTPELELCELFEALFGADELRRFVGLRYQRLTTSLLERDSLAGLASSLVQLLVRHGLVDAHLFAQLLAVRPACQDRILACAGRWGLCMRPLCPSDGFNS